MVVTVMAYVSKAIRNYILMVTMVNLGMISSCSINITNKVSIQSAASMSVSEILGCEEVSMVNWAKDPAEFLFRSLQKNDRGRIAVYNCSWIWSLLSHNLT
jgi:hypothetical protein